MVSFESIVPLQRGKQQRSRGRPDKSKRGPRASAGPEALLVGASPSAILARIQEGDPLGIGTLSLERMRSRACLIALDRLTARAMARAAYAAFLRPIRDSLESWLSSVVEQSLDELIADDRQDLLAGEDILRPTDWRYEFLANAMGVSCEVARRASVAFNDLPLEVRKDYWALCVEEVPMEAHASATDRPRARILSNMRRALLTLTHLEDPGVSSSEDGGSLA